MPGIRQDALRARPTPTEPPPESRSARRLDPLLVCGPSPLPTTTAPPLTDRELSPKHHAQARTPSPPSRRRSRAARRSRRTSTSATRRPRPSTSARPSSRPSASPTRRRPSRRSLAKNWRRCSTRSTWPSARRRCASRREKFDPPHPPVCVKHLSWNYAQGTLAKTMDKERG